MKKATKAGSIVLDKLQELKALGYSKAKCIAILGKTFVETNWANV